MMETNSTIPGGGTTGLVQDRRQWCHSANPSAPIGDLDLLEEWRRGGRTAGETLVRRYYARVVRFIGSSVRDIDEALDLTQATFETAVVRRDDVRVTFGSFLMGIARLKVLSYRNDRRKMAARHACSDTDALVDHDLEGRLMARERAEHLEDAFVRLPERDQDILSQVAGGERLRDVASHFGVSVGSIGGRVHRARRRLREQCDEAPVPATRQRAFAG